MEPKACGLRIVQLKSEEGNKELAGIIFKWCVGAEVYRKVVFFSETGWFIEEELMKPLERLREKEPFEAYAELNSMKAKAHPAIPFNLSMQSS